jgi:histidyl-tRNA synthetase
MLVVTSVRGYPEWLPVGQIVERRMLEIVREVFELYGYAPLQTRAVEPLGNLLSKGETDKEIYTLRRLHADDDESAARAGLRFDLTVPLARYVSENAGRLLFPYRRYQIQSAWRGERPQEGRYREFVQADIDIVGRQVLPPGAEAEVPVVVADALRRLPLPPIVVRVNSRKILEGFFRGLGREDSTPLLHAIDKLGKIGAAAVQELLAEAGLSPAQARKCLELASIRGTDASFAKRAGQLGVTDPLLDEGLRDLVEVIEAGTALHPGVLTADLSIARGLDYYTGTVYETEMLGYESLGSVCSGGRYDNLISGGRDAYPGVGMSIGITRILGPLMGRGALTASRSVPTCVLVAVAEEAARPDSAAVATTLRSRGIAAEVSPSAAKYGKQIRYAQQRGIPFVWFPAPTGGEVRDIRSGGQSPAVASEWTPPPADLTPTILPGDRLHR